MPHCVSPGPRTTARIPGCTPCRIPETSNLLLLIARDRSFPTALLAGRRGWTSQHQHWRASWTPVLILEMNPDEPRRALLTPMRRISSVRANAFPCLRQSIVRILKRAKITMGSMTQCPGYSALYILPPYNAFGIFRPSGTHQSTVQKVSHYNVPWRTCFCSVRCARGGSARPGMARMVADDLHDDPLP